MKPIPIVLSPTRSRALNMFLGLVLSLVSVLLFLALATYHPSDSSLNTASGADAPHARFTTGSASSAPTSAISCFRPSASPPFSFRSGSAALAGLDAFALRRLGPPALDGHALTILFVPAVLGLLPWHWHWLHAVPVEGVMGRFVAGALVVYLNIQGAWLVATALPPSASISLPTSTSGRSRQRLKIAGSASLPGMIAGGTGAKSVPSASAISKSAMRRADPARSRTAPLLRCHRRPHRTAARRTMPPPRMSRLAALFGMQKARARARSGRRNSRLPAPPPNQRTNQFPRDASSIWERTVADSATPVATRAGPPQTRRAKPSPAAPAPVAATRPAPPPQQSFEMRPAPAPAHPHPLPHQLSLTAPSSIAIHERADADERTVTVAPKNVSGFKLPPSTLLNSGSGPQIVREDELREEARVLVEKCAEFDVTRRR